MNKIYERLVRSILAILIAFLAGCGQTGGTNLDNREPRGTIVISGAWALYPLMVQWADRFQSENPEVRFDISAGGAGKGMTDVLADAVDIGMVSRQVYPEEEGRGAFWVSVAKDAVFVTVSEENPVWDDLRQKGLRREILIMIFITGEIDNWGEVVDRAELTEPIHVFTRSDAAGAPATWAEYLGSSQEDLLGIGVYGDPGLLDAVIKDPLGIGYNNLNYAYDQETGKPVAGALVAPIDINNNGLVDPGEYYDTKEKAVRAVAADVYPSPPTRDLNLVTHGRPSGLTLRFITWILTDGQQLIEESGYIDLSEDRISAELRKLD